EQSITGSYATVAETQREMEALRADYLARIAQVAAEARARIQAAIKEAQTERERLMAEARAQSDAAIREGVAAMEREKTEALQQLRDHMVGWRSSLPERRWGLPQTRPRCVVRLKRACIGAPAAAQTPPAIKTALKATVVADASTDGDPIGMLLAEIHFGPFAIEHPETVLAMLVGLALLVLLLGRFGLPSARSMLNDRAARIEENLTQVQRALEDVQRQRNDYAARIAQIETEARQRIDAAVREAETSRAEIIAEAEQTANALRRRAEEEIARERTRQRIRLRQEIVQLTLNAAEQSVRAHTNESVQRQLIGDFIARAAKDGGNGRTVRAAPSGNGVTAPQPRIPQEGEA